MLFDLQSTYTKKNSDGDFLHRSQKLLGIIDGP